jgi:hypothetical protein
MQINMWPRVPREIEKTRFAVKKKNVKFDATRRNCQAAPPPED